ncbi:DUF3068 domain-containing protein [Nocardia amamiensis]|uniref:DUF3068 domain-containing protein n=1 Tax=Nocardia amamiensis TaxID=404578 RepID=A0ABS0D298_9NOCA|nr:porin PorA family protein [Nocardia amamiensis]MBF6302916.1 DUF3068 domain-containing protein [Nocardia amamiensis]
MHEYRNKEHHTMLTRRSAVALAIAGAVLIALAALLRLAVIPFMTKLPEDLDAKVRFEGTMMLLNSQALASGDVSDAIVDGIPISVDRHVRVAATVGDIAIVHDKSTINGPNGMSMGQSHVYAVDRVSFGRAPAPAGMEVEPHEGITVSLPINPPADNSMKLWEAVTQNGVPLSYTGSGVVLGRAINNYTGIAVGSVKDDATLKRFPPELPKRMIEQILPQLPPDTQTRIRAAIPLLPDITPLSYSATNTVRLAADARLGMPITAAREQKIVARLDLNGEYVDLLPVMALKVDLTGQSSAEAAARAQALGRTLDLVEVWAPLALVVAGFGLVAVAVMRRKARTGDRLYDFH